MNNQDSKVNSPEELLAKLEKTQSPFGISVALITETLGSTKAFVSEIKQTEKSADKLFTIKGAAGISCVIKVSPNGSPKLLPIEQTNYLISNYGLNANGAGRSAVEKNKNTNKEALLAIATKTREILSNLDATNKFSAEELENVYTAFSDEYDCESDGAHTYYNNLTYLSKYKSTVDTFTHEKGRINFCNRADEHSSAQLKNS